MSAVLVTGGAGYIGSHAVKALVEAGHRVVIYDNLSAGHREAAARAGGGRRHAGRGRHRRHGAASAQVMRGARASTRSCTSPPGCRWATRCAIRPATTATTSMGALSVLDAMVAAGVKHFVFSSTAAVFGNPRSRRRSPKTHPRRPINAYGETKLAIERALPHYERAYGLRSICAALFQRRRRRPRRRARRAPRPGAARASRGPSTRRSAAARSRCSARTTTRRTAPACATTSTSPTWRRRTCWRSTRCATARPSTVYNLGNGRPTSVRAILESVERVTGRRVPYTPGAAPRRRPGGAVRLERPHPPRARLGARSSRTSTPSSKPPGGGASAIRTATQSKVMRVDVASARRDRAIRCSRW